MRPNLGLTRKRILGIFFGALLAGAGYVGKQNVPFIKLIQSKNAQKNTTNLNKLPRNIVVPLTTSQITLPGSSSAQTLPVFVYNGSSYVQNKNSLVPVEPIYKKSNGTVAPLITPAAQQSSITPAGYIKRPNGTVIDPLHYYPISTWHSFLWGRSTNRAKAAQLMLNEPSINSNVKLNNVTFKKNNSETPIPIANLTNKSKVMIIGTNISQHIDALVPILNTALKSNAARNSGLNVQNSISKLNSLAKQNNIDQLMKLPFMTKMYSFIIAANFTTNGRLMLANGTNTNLTPKEQEFFKLLFSNREFVKHMLAISDNIKQLALPPGTKATIQQEKTFSFVAAATILASAAYKGYSTYKSVQLGVQVVQAIAAGNPAVAAPAVLVQVGARILRSTIKANPGAAALLTASNALNKLINAGLAVK